jgi:hypothetical protein
VQNETNQDKIFVESGCPEVAGEKSCF